LIANLLRYSERFLKRHGLWTVTISVRLHEGQVVRVRLAHSTCFPVARTLGCNLQVPDRLREGDHRRSRALTPDELNARIGLRVHRLVRHFGLRFGALKIKVEGATIKTIQPSPPLRPVELERLAKLASEITWGRRVAWRGARRPGE